MYKEDLALNNLQWLMCHKTQPNQTKLNLTKPIFFYLLNSINRLFIYNTVFFLFCQLTNFLYISIFHIAFEYWFNFSHRLRVLIQFFTSPSSPDSIFHIAFESWFNFSHRLRVLIQFFTSPSSPDSIFHIAFESWFNFSHRLRVLIQFFTSPSSPDSIFHIAFESWFNFSHRLRVRVLIQFFTSPSNPDSIFQILIQWVDCTYISNMRHQKYSSILFPICFC